MCSNTKMTYPKSPASIVKRRISTRSINNNIAHFSSMLIIPGSQWNIGIQQICIFHPFMKIHILIKLCINNTYYRFICRMGN